MKLKSLASFTKGRKINLPLVGKVRFDDENCITVEDEIGENILSFDMGNIKLEKVVEQKSIKEDKKVEKIKNVSEDSDGDKEEKSFVSDDKNTDEGDEKKEITFDTLMKNSLNQLKEYCAAFPKEEWIKLTAKKDIVEYLVLKLN